SKNNIFLCRRARYCVFLKNRRVAKAEGDYKGHPLISFFVIIGYGFTFKGKRRNTKICQIG
ncbi:MAG: hypothetical protein KKF44_10300, partial [Nanoarchaeota archaeon]|nr:hypothetical protein [Nanoarchaeota archaeon]